MSDAGSGPSATMMEIKVKMMQLVPSLLKTVILVHARKKDAPTVVTALPSDAPPIALNAYVARWNLIFEEASSTVKSQAPL